MATAIPTPSPAQPGGLSVTNGIKLTDTKRGKIYLGQLPNDFLRLHSHVSQDSAMAQQIAIQQQQAMAQTAALATAYRLTITVIEAKLNKNYGVTRMDPYCRLRIGSNVYETMTAVNGSKTPYWGKTMTVGASKNLEKFDVEIFDERAFSVDNRIAWCSVPVTESIKNGKDEDDWWPLNGKLGEEKEGMIHLQLSWKQVQQPVYYNSPIPMVVPNMYSPATPMVMMPGAPYYVPGAFPQTQQAAPVITEEDLKQVKEMFPNVDDEVIKTVMEVSGGNKDAAINSLLSMQ